MLFKAKIKYDVLMHFIQVVGEMSSEIRVDLLVGEKGGPGGNPILHTRTVDFANVAMVEGTIKDKAILPLVSAFEGDTLEMGWDLSKMRKGLKWMKGDNILMEIQDKKMILTGRGVTLQCSLLDVNTLRRRPNPPKIELPCHFKVFGSEFLEALQIVKGFDDRVVFEVEEGQKVLKVYTLEDSEGTKVEDALPFNGDLCPRGARSLFNAEYLIEVCRHLKDQTLEASLGVNFPMSIAWEYGKGEGDFYFLQAPRIESE